MSEEDLRSYLDRKLRIGKLDSALLFLSSSMGIVFGLVQGLMEPESTFPFLVPVLVLGWGLPFYYGYLLGAVRKDTMIDRYRGWIFLVVGVGTYSMIFSTQLLSQVITAFPPLLITGPSGFFIGWYVARHGTSLANFVFGTAGEKPTLVTSQIGGATAGAALFIALGSALLLIFRQEVVMYPLAAFSFIVAAYFLRESGICVARVGLLYTVVEVKGKYSGSRRMRKVARVLQFAAASTLVSSWVTLAYEGVFSSYYVTVASIRIGLPVMMTLLASVLLLVSFRVTDSTRTKKDLQFA